MMPLQRIECLDQRAVLGIGLEVAVDHQCWTGRCQRIHCKSKIDHGISVLSNEPKEHKAALNAPFTARGTYNGAPGEYRCTIAEAGQTCVSRAATSGGIELSGTQGVIWIFDPDPGAMQADPDKKYATFGWWLDERDAVEVGTFSSVQKPATTPDVDVTGVTGKATYNGIAVGKAAFSAALGDNNIGGAFTADATLSATFGGAGASMLKGEITNFMIGDESPNWSVTLNEATITTGSVGDSAGADTTWSIDGVMSTKSGGWTARMYDQPEAVGSVSGQPKGVTGGFDSAFGEDGRMVGAFGAEK